MYELHQNIMCVQSSVFVEALDIKLSTYCQWCKRGWLQLIRRGGNGRKALIAFDTMRDDLKSRLIQISGDPYKCHHHQEFINSIKRDYKAIEFYNGYRLEKGVALPQKNIEQYVLEASILNAVYELVQLRRAKSRKASLLRIWETAANLVLSLPPDRFPHTLPGNARRLKEKCLNFKKEGYIGLIHKNFCNTNSEKINESAKLWVLARWADQVNKCPSLNHLLIEYNYRASEKGWQTLKSTETLRNYLDRGDVYQLWYGKRYGELKAKEKFMYQHKTTLPSMRDSLWYSDGTKLNLFYLGSSGKIETCNVYEVMDSYSEVFLGFHISKTEDFEAQYHAYKMALKYSGHRPYQIKYDNQGGHKKLLAGHFLDKIAMISTNTKPYNGKSKTIESAFGRFQQHYLKQLWFFTGQNITSKADESKANMEFILANKNNLPSLEEATEAYIRLRTEWNCSAHPKTGISREEMYRCSSNPLTPELSLLDLVDLFWIEREKPITVDAYGISFQEKKIRYDFMVYTAEGLPDLRWLRKHIDQKFHIKFDPEEMSMIYLYKKESGSLRFVVEARTKVIIHRGAQEQLEGEVAFIRQVNHIEQLVRMEARDEMDEILRKHDRLPEQQGLKSPHLKGIESGKSKKGTVDQFAVAQKQISQLDPETEDSDELNIYQYM